MAAPLILSAPNGNAQIVYVDANPDIVLPIAGQELSIDLNGDGIYDFGFGVTQSTTGIFVLPGRRSRQGDLCPGPCRGPRQYRVQYPRSHV